MSLPIGPVFNSEIESFLSSYHLPFFRGVFSSNNIPNFKGNFIIICNLSNELQAGTHFITLARIDKEMLILDSLALNIGNKELIKSINLFSKKCDTITYLNHAIQSATSDGCGIFCIFFVFLYHARLKKRMPILQKFKKPHQNDAICINNVNILRGDFLARTT